MSRFKPYLIFYFVAVIDSMLKILEGAVAEIEEPPRQRNEIRKVMHQPEVRHDHR